MTAADVVHQFYGALAKGEPATAFALLSPDVAWTEAAGFVYAGTYHGPQDVAANVFAPPSTVHSRLAALAQEWAATARIWRTASSTPPFHGMP
jgi:ketosteroid isomerase-like protein